MYTFPINDILHLFKNAAVGDLLKEQEKSGRIVGAICAGIYVILIFATTKVNSYQ